MEPEPCGLRPNQRCGAELITEFDMEEIGDYLHDKIGLTDLDCWFQWSDTSATIWLRGEFPNQGSCSAWRRPT